MSQQTGENVATNHGGDDPQLTSVEELLMLENGLGGDEPADFRLTATDADGESYQEQSKPGELLDWARLQGPIRPRIWFVKGWLTTVPTLFAARGGTGKSLQMQTMCTAIATGKHHIGEVEKARSCLIWSCEDDPDEILRRQSGINRYFRVTDTDLGRLHINPRIGLENTLMDLVDGKLTATPVLKILQEQVNDLRAEVLVLDNVAHLYGGLDDRTQVTKFVSTITGLVTGRPFAPIFVTHVSKMTGSEYTGSVAWENAVRMRWFLENGEFEDLHQHVQKSNVSSKISTVLRIVNGVMVPKSAREVEETIKKERAERARRQEHVESIVIDGLAAILAMPGEKAVAKRGSQDGLIKVIIRHKLDQDASEEELKEAYERLEVARRIQVGFRGNKYSNGAKVPEVIGISPRSSDSSITVAA